MNFADDDQKSLLPRIVRGATMSMDLPGGCRIDLRSGYAQATYNEEENRGI